MNAASEAFLRLSRELIGRRVAHAWNGYGSMISLEIGELSSRSKRDGTPLQPDGEVSLMIEWSWRIESAAEILCGSWGNEELWQPVLARMVGATVTRCELFGSLAEIALSVDTGLRLVSFATVEGQPQWGLIDRRSSDSQQWFSVRGGRLHLGDGTDPA